MVYVDAWPEIGRPRHSANDHISGGGGRRPVTRCHTRLIRNKTTKITNRILAMVTSDAASPPKPNTAAMSARTKKMIAQPSVGHLQTEWDRESVRSMCYHNILSAGSITLHIAVSLHAPPDSNTTITHR